MTFGILFVLLKKVGDTPIHALDGLDELDGLDGLPYGRWAR